MTLKPKLKIMGAVIPAVFLIDQAVKRLVVSFMALGDFIPVVPGLFDIVHVRNRGAAFGFLAGLPDEMRVPFFLTVSLASLGLITLYFFRMNDDRKSVFVCLSLILGGACGNIWDRIFLGEVVDFLSFHWYDRSVTWRVMGHQIRMRLEWPAFNVADAAITVAVVSLLFLFMAPKK